MASLSLGACVSQRDWRQATQRLDELERRQAAVQTEFLVLAKRVLDVERSSLGRDLDLNQVLQHLEREQDRLEQVIALFRERLEQRGVVTRNEVELAVARADQNVVRTGIAPLSAAELLAGARVALLKGDAATAILAYEEYLGRFPASRDLAEVRYGLGLAYARLGDLRGALEHWEAALAAPGGTALREELWWRMARASLDLNMKEKSRNYWTELVGTFPASAYAADGNLTVLGPALATGTPQPDLNATVME